MGRPAGSPNVRTVQRKLVKEYRANGIPMAKEMMEELALFYFEAAKQLTPPLPLPKDYDPDKLRKFHSMAEKCLFFARSLAPYQSPTYRSITVQAPRESSKGTPALDGLEAFMVTLAAVRRREPEPKEVIDGNGQDDDTPVLVEVKRNGQ